MAKLGSAMVSLGSEAPAFSLEDVVSGKTVTREDALGGKAGLLVMFVCVHCPYVKHIEAELGRIGKTYGERIGIVAVQPNDVEQYPEDAPAGMQGQAKRLGWSFPYLLDQTQAVARAYDAVCTPDLFLYDRGLRLLYRGQLDSSRPQRPSGGGNDLPVTGADLRAALEAVLAGHAPSLEQQPGIGCSIKWRSA